MMPDDERPGWEGNQRRAILSGLVLMVLAVVIAVGVALGVLALIRWAMP